MYLPLSIEESDQPQDVPIFYGAINMYLKEKLPLFKYAPGWLKKLFEFALNYNIRITSKIRRFCIRLSRINPLTKLCRRKSRIRDI